MSDEEDVGHFMKHARAAELTFGDASFHKDRFAMIKDYRSRRTIITGGNLQPFIGTEEL